MSNNPPAATLKFEDGPGVPYHTGAKDIGYDDSETMRLFGCPFYKRDPVKYLFCMMRQTLTGTNYVKQHLVRYHRPPIHCPTCGEVFQQKSARDAHIEKNTCARREFKLEGMNLEQQEALRRTSRFAGHEERWYQIWDILFPGEPRPESPYVDDALEEIGRVYLKQLNQQQPGTAQVLGPDTIAHTETHHEIPTVVPYRQADPSLQHHLGGVTFTSAHQPGSSVESGFSMKPRHPELDYIINAQQGLDADATLSAPTEGAQVQIPPSTTPYPVVPSFHVGDLPEDATNTPEVLKHLEDPTVGDANVDGVTPSYETPGLSTPPDEKSEIKGPPPPHLLKPKPDGYEAELTEDGGSSCQDSGYVSRETRDKARGYNVDDACSIYSTDSISLESKSRYITTFTSRLAQDICKLARVSTIPYGSQELLLEWVRTFALKLHGESSTRTKREASVFIRQYRKYVIVFQVS